MGGNSSSGQKMNSFREVQSSAAKNIKSIGQMFNHLIGEIKPRLAELSAQNLKTAEEKLTEITNKYKPWIESIDNLNLDLKRNGIEFATHSMNLAIDEVTMLDVHLIGEIVKEDREAEIEEVKRFKGWAVCLDTSGWNCFVVRLVDGLLSVSDTDRINQPHLFGIFNCGTKIKRIKTSSGLLSADILYGNNDHYEGKMLNFKPHTDSPKEEGKFTFRNGNEFIGHFKEGLMHSLRVNGIETPCKLRIYDQENPNKRKKVTVIEGIWVNGVLSKCSSQKEEDVNPAITAARQ